MLHIILVILKCIGLVLLVILGILFLLIFLALILPLCYAGNVNCEEDQSSLQWRLKFSWFFHLLAGDIVFKKQQLRWKIRIAWKVITSQKEEEKETFAVKKTNENVSEHDDTNENKNTSNSEKCHYKREGNAIPHATIEEKPPLKIQNIKENEDSNKEEKGKETEQDKSSKQFFERRKKTTLYQRISGIVKKIKYTFRKFYATIKGISRRKDFIFAFIENDAHKSAFLALWKEVCRLMKRLKPKRFVADIDFGFEDPANTGFLLAFLSICYPLFGEQVTIRPEFEEKKFVGSIEVKGSLNAIVFVIPCWNLLWKKDVRKTYKDFKKILKKFK